jgi:Tol biopolymer transport system component
MRLRNTLALLVCVCLASGASLDATRVPPTFAVTVGPGAPRFNADLWVVRGSRVARIVRTRRIGIREPAWSPRSDRIAFTVVRDPVLERGLHVFVANVDGTRPRRLTAAGSGVAEYTPAWSPDGREIAYARAAGAAAPAIWLVRSNGRSPRRLTSGWSPAWAPDGKRLVFTDGAMLWTIRRDGAGRRRLTAPPSRAETCDFSGGESSDYEGEPDWSPDGRLIAFVRHCGSGETSEDDEIYVIRPDGTGLRRVTSGPADDSPSWAPDGRRLAFVRLFEADVVPRGGGTVRRLFRPAGREVYAVAFAP